MGRQKSDDRVVLKGRRKTVPSDTSRGGKAVTVEEQANQLALFVETAESPKGAQRKVVAGAPAKKSVRVPKSTHGKRTSLLPMTMENIADEANLRAAFSKVAANRGAAGPDRTSIMEVRERLDEYMSRIRSSLLDGSYREGQ